MLFYEKTCFFGVFWGGGPLWAPLGPKREFCRTWLVDLFFQAHKGDEKNVLLSQI